MNSWNRWLRAMGIALLVLAAAIIVAALAGCAPTGPTEPQKTPQQIWIEAHPTHLNDRGECIEFDDEPCDEDPYDLDDWYESFNKTKAPSKKPSPKPMKTAFQPKPTKKK